MWAGVCFVSGVFGGIAFYFSLDYIKCFLYQFPPYYLDNVLNKFEFNVATWNYNLPPSAWYLMFRSCAPPEYGENSS